MKKMECQYDIPWYGKCKKETIDGTDYCKEHTRLCFVCNKEQATHGCSCAGSFVCGTPLCSSENCIEKHYKTHY